MWPLNFISMSPNNLNRISTSDIIPQEECGDSTSSTIKTIKVEQLKHKHDEDVIDFVCNNNYCYYDYDKGDGNDGEARKQVSLIILDNYTTKEEEIYNNMGQVVDFDSKVDNNHDVNHDKAKINLEEQIKISETKSCIHNFSFRKYFGIILALIASLNLSAVLLFAKLLQHYNYHGNCTSFWRYVGIAVPTIPILVYKIFEPIASCSSPTKNPQESIFKPIWPLNVNNNWRNFTGLLLRGFFATITVLLRYYALEYLPMGDTVVISYSTPILVTILEHFFLSVKAKVWSFVAAGVTLIGVVIVAKPPLLFGSESFTSNTMTGTALALGSLFCSALQLILTRQVRSVHFSLTTIIGGLIGLLLCTLLLLHFNDFVIPTQLFQLETYYLIGLCSCSFLGQICLILALKYEVASRVSLLRSIDIIFGFLFQYAFLAVIPSWSSGLGGALIFGSVLLSTIYK